MLMREAAVFATAEKVRAAPSIYLPPREPARLAALVSQGAQCDIAHFGGGRISRQHLGNSESCPKISHAGLRASWRLSDCCHKTQIARPAFACQGAQCDCAAHPVDMRTVIQSAATNLLPWSDSDPTENSCQGARVR